MDLLYPCICWWTSRLFPYLSYCINSATINIGVFVFFWILVLSGICVGMGLLDHVVTSMFSLLIKVQQECGKADLKLNIQKKRKDHGILVHHFMTHRRGKIGNGNRSILILGVSKITADRDCSHEIKRYLFLGRKVMTNLDSILKSRDITLQKKGPYSQTYGFPRSNVQMCTLYRAINKA